VRSCRSALGFRLVSRKRYPCEGNVPHFNSNLCLIDVPSAAPIPSVFHPCSIRGSHSIRGRNSFHDRTRLRSVAPACPRLAPLEIEDVRECP